MFTVFERIRRAAQVDSPVLIWGAQGTGKKLVAQTIHRQSQRAGGPLVIVRTASNSRWPPGQTRGDLAEFEGDSQWEGQLHSARGGTLLIDEVAGLSAPGQARLLGAVEGRNSRGAGSGDQSAADFRLMATTRSELSESVKQGKVREDLSYCLAVVTIRIPSLWERREDVPQLVSQLLAELCAARQRPVPAVDPELMRLLVQHPWPGNVAQLRQCLESLVLAADADTLGVSHLPKLVAEEWFAVGDSSSEGSNDKLAELERRALLRALKVHQGNRTLAAKSLGISVRTLQRKLKYWSEP